MVVAVVMEGYAVEFLKRIGSLTTGRCEAAVERHALHRPRPADVHTLALLDVAEVDGVEGTPLIWYDWWLHVSDQSPLSRPEEGMYLDVRSSCTGTQSAILVLDKQLAYERFAQTTSPLAEAIEFVWSWALTLIFGALQRGLGTECLP